MKYRIKIIILLLLLSETSLFAQERTGIANSNYYPSMGIFLNPAYSADSRSFIQLHLAGFHAYLKTNLGYLPKFSAWSLLRGGIPAPVLSDNKRMKFAHAEGSAELPVFVMSKGRFSGGAFIRANSLVNLRRIPYEVPGMLMGNLPDGPSSGSFSSRNAGGANMSWWEYGINFGMMVHRGQKFLVTAGTNLKYVRGINFFYANVDELNGFYSPALLRIDTVRGRVRYSASAPGSGRGFAADLGIVFKRTYRNSDRHYSHSVRSNCKYIDYKYRASFSLRDLGFLRFPNSMMSNLNGSATYFAGETRQSMLPYLNAITNFSLLPAAVTALMPASASAQFDYNLEYDFYLNVTAVKNMLPNRVVGVQRADMIAIAPRYETRNFEFALPFTLHRYMYPQIGFGFRFRSLVIGMDNLLPLVIKSNTSGLSAYVNLAVTIFRNPACGTGSPRVADCPPKLRPGGQYRAPGFLKKLFRFRKTYSK